MSCHGNRISRESCANLTLSLVSVLSESLLSCMVAMTTGLTNFRSSCFLASHLLPPPPSDSLKELTVKPAEQISR